MNLGYNFRVKRGADRYSDDQDFAMRSFEKRVKFCEESDEMIEKNEKQIDDEKDKPEDDLVMNKIRKMSGAVLNRIILSYTTSRAGN